MAIRTTPQLGTIRANGQSQKFYGIYLLQDFSYFHSNFLKSTATAPRFVDGTLCCLQDGWRCTTFAVSGDEMSARVKLGWTTISLDINILYILVFMTKMNNWNKFIIKLTKNLSNMWGKCDEGIFSRLLCGLALEVMHARGQRSWGLHSICWIKWRGSHGVNIYQKRERNNHGVKETSMAVILLPKTPRSIWKLCDSW